MKTDRNGNELKLGDWVWLNENTEHYEPRKDRITKMYPKLKVLRVGNTLVNPNHVRKCEIEDLI